MDSQALQTNGPARSRLTLTTILCYERVDLLSGGLLLAMLVFCPWAFGATQPWSIWTLNICGYVLGLLLVMKGWIRFRLGHAPLRWDSISDSAAGWQNRLTQSLATITLVLLAYCFISILNARADYDPVRLTLNYREYLRWLPHTYDRAATTRAFFDYLAWACFFWSLRDWLLGMDARESRAARSDPGSTRAVVPSRLKILLWVIAVNGALLGLEGIIQRIVGSDKLLFLVQPRINPFSSAHFGPFAYRSNAAQYLNLIWPVALGFWWWLQRTAARSTKLFPARHLLLLCAAIMAACPIISSSRAGALTDILMLAIVAMIFISHKHTDGLIKLTMLGVTGAAIAAGAYFGWSSLSPRLGEFAEGFRYRELMFDTARIIARENPVFGTGPGTFENVFQLYRHSTEEYWPAQLHNDWLELLLTFGWVGFMIMLAALALMIAHAFRSNGIRASHRFVWLIWLALSGCLLQARWDFPFRVHSIVILFLALGSILTVLARTAKSR